MMDLILALLLGAAFGFALYNAGAANRGNIRSMLRLENLELMKIILFAIGLASTLLAVSAVAGIFDTSHLSIKGMNGGVLLGGIIFGLGFGYVGSCPGTSLASLPYSHKAKTLGIISGGLAGALAYSLSYGWWNDLGLFKTLDLGSLTLFNLSAKNPAVFELGFTGLMLVGIMFMLTAYLLPARAK